MSFFPYWSGHYLFLCACLIFFVLQLQILPCKAECTLLNPSPSERALMEKLKPLHGHIFETKDLNFSYKVSICDKIKGEKDGVGVIQIDKSENHILGRYDHAEIKGGDNWLFLTYYGGDIYTHHCNHSERVTNIMISCIPDLLYGELQILEERLSNVTSCFYLFELESSVSCSKMIKNEDKNRMSFGSVFCILFFTFGSVYLVLGFLYKRLVIGAKGLEQIPNYTFWKEFGNLQADGCDFLCRCGARQESQAYRGIDDHLKIEDERDDQLLNM